MSVFFMCGTSTLEQTALECYHVSYRPKNSGRISSGEKIFRSFRSLFSHYGRRSSRRAAPPTCQDYVTFSIGIAWLFQLTVSLCERAVSGFQDSTKPPPVHLASFP